MRKLARRLWHAFDPALDRLGCMLVGHRWGGLVCRDCGAAYPAFARLRDNARAMSVTIGAYLLPSLRRCTQAMQDFEDALTRVRVTIEGGS